MISTSKGLRKVVAMAVDARVLSTSQNLLGPTKYLIISKN